MMGGIFFWLIIGMVLYLALSKRGGTMGCCGHHNHNHPKQTDRSIHDSDDSSNSGEIITLKKEDYHVHT